MGTNKNIIYSILFEYIPLDGVCCHFIICYISVLTVFVYLFCVFACLTPQSIVSNCHPYIQEAGFAGSQKPQVILNFPQKDCLRTRKLSIPQCVLEVKVKSKDCCHSTLRYRG